MQRKSQSGEKDVRVLIPYVDCRHWNWSTILWVRMIPVPYTRVLSCLVRRVGHRAQVSSGINGWVKIKKKKLPPRLLPFSRAAGPGSPAWGMMTLGREEPAFAHYVASMNRSSGLGYSCTMVKSINNIEVSSNVRS